MKKVLVVLFFVFSIFSFADTWLEDHIEDILEQKYEYISDGTTRLELDIDVHERKNDVLINVKVDDDYRNVKQNFNRSYYNKVIKEIEGTAKKEANGKKVIIKSIF
ncbi:hypothetical protein [Sebaldella sp. S0638]|uniref:hypothetical protein n=1 Tax=Sebaldella sp. S0638 TaxID=2957809 RepID=UPI00209DC5D6|nr:hypothetical protein [Sebaldella sp. S0638]MCP1226186.1 hypothetical protein [Sebaldella sp. S0638]